MRVAVNLSDQDVRYLRGLIRIEGDLLKVRDHIPRYDGHMKWEQGSWGSRVDPEVESIFSKLESYGLVSRIAPPNNQNLMGDSPNRYLLLKKGLRFATLAQESANRPYRVAILLPHRLSHPSPRHIQRFRQHARLAHYRHEIRVGDPAR
jgi:hypothetical protein